MNIKILKLTFLLFVCGSLVFPSRAFAAKSYTAEQFDVVVNVLQGGDLLVTETVAFNFAGGPFTYVFRDLETVETDGISDLRASLDDQPLPQGQSAGQVEIQPGNPIRVTWHFNPLSDATHTFELSYRVHGALRQAGYDTLIWRAVPEKHEYPIASSAITLDYPSGVSLSGDPQLSRPVSQMETSEHQVWLVTQDVPPDRSVVLTAKFVPGSLISSPPLWQIRRAAQRSATKRALPVALGSAALVLLIASAWLWRIVHTVQREDVSPLTLPSRINAPPSPLPPALGVRLASGSLPALATLFDLARRGILRIEETKSRWGKSFVIYRQPYTEALSPHEQSLLDVLFKTSKGHRDSLPMSETGTKIAYGGGVYSKSLEEELVARGWLDLERKRLHSRLVVIGLLALFLGIAVAIASFLLVGAATRQDTLDILPFASALVGVGAAIFIAGVAAIIVGETISQLSPSGEYLAARWKAFIAHLRDISRGREPAPPPDLFELYLPFAAGAGFAQAWAKAFQMRGGAPLPEWFHTLNGRMDGSEFGAIVALMAISDTSVSAGGDAGGAGASGGGASGAG